MNILNFFLKLFRKKSIPKGIATSNFSTLRPAISDSVVEARMRQMQANYESMDAWFPGINQVAGKDIQTYLRNYAIKKYGFKYISSEDGFHVLKQYWNDGRELEIHQSGDMWSIYINPDPDEVGMYVANRYTVFFTSQLDYLLTQGRCGMMVRLKMPKN